MDLNRFTEKAQQALVDAQHRAGQQGNAQIDNEHILAALLDQEPGLAASILRKADVSVETLKRKVENELTRLPRVSGDGQEPGLSPRAQRLLRQAEAEAKTFKDDYVSIEHILLSLVDDGGAAGRLLKESDVSRDKLMSALQEVR
ncbi:MAG TPA: Clp protease N-terminal domain-containing protein, partial [Gemmataceae bacterium]